MSTQRIERSTHVGALLSLGLRAQGADLQGEAGAFEHVMQVQQDNVIPPVKPRSRRDEQEQEPRRDDAPITEAVRTTSQEERQEMREETADAPVVTAPRTRTESREAPVSIKGPPPSRKTESQDEASQADAEREVALQAMAQQERATALIVQLAEQLLPVSQAVTVASSAVPTLSTDVQSEDLAVDVSNEDLVAEGEPVDTVQMVAVPLVAPVVSTSDRGGGPDDGDNARAQSDLVQITFHSTRAVSPKRQDVMHATQGAAMQKTAPSDDIPVQLAPVGVAPLVQSGARVLLHSTAAQRAVSAAAASDAAGTPGHDLRAVPLQQPTASQALRGTALTQASLRIRSVPAQVGEALQVAIREKQDVVRIQLEPPSFGKIYVRVGMRHNEVHVAFMAEQPFTRDALERGLPHLRNLLQEQGLSLGDVHVGFGDEAAWQESMDGERFFAERPLLTEEQTAEDAVRPRFVRPIDPQAVVDVSV